MTSTIRRARSCVTLRIICGGGQRRYHGARTDEAQSIGLDAATCTTVTRNGADLVRFLRGRLAGWDWKPRSPRQRHSPIRWRPTARPDDAVTNTTLKRSAINATVTAGGVTYIIPCS